MRLEGLLSLVCLIGGPAAAQEPTAAIRQRVEAYVAAVNADTPVLANAVYDRDMSAAHRAWAPREAVVSYFVNQRRVMGGLDLLDIRVVGPRRAQALVRDRIYGARHGLTLDLDGTAAAHVDEFDPGPTPPWAPALPRDQSTAEIVTQAQALVLKGCNAEVFSGAVLLAHRDQVLMQHACGFANRRYEARNTVETRFSLGSINKAFTAVALMQLAEARKLSLDDPLSKHLDQTWLAPEVSRTITLRHLIMHTSGLGSFLNPEWGRSSPRLFDKLEDYKPLVRGETPAFPPGSAYAYSNTGMLLLGAVVEKVSGEDYFDYVRGHIFQPAGMASTDSWTLAEPVQNVAVGYGWTPETPFGWSDNTPYQVYRGSPAGSGYSTVGDLHRFALALQDGRLVSETSRDVLWTENAPHEYGAGFTVQATAAGKVVGHDGIFMGVSTRFRMYLDRGYVVAILGNQDYAAPGLDEALTELISRGR